MLEYSSEGIYTNEIYKKYILVHTSLISFDFFFIYQKVCIKVTFLSKFFLASPNKQKLFHLYEPDGVHSNAVLEKMSSCIPHRRKIFQLHAPEGVHSSGFSVKMYT